MTTRILWARVLVASFALGMASCGDDDDNGNEPLACDAPSWSHAATPTESSTFCADAYVTLCARAFGDCGFAHLHTSSFEMYANEGQCQTNAPIDFCDDDYLAETAADATLAADCLSTLDTVACSAFNESLRTCSDTLDVVPPQGVDCEFVAPGTYDVEITATLPSFGGGHYKAFCVCLGGGQSISATTDVPENSELAILDPTLHLFAPQGQHLGTVGRPSPPGTLGWEPWRIGVGASSVGTAGGYMIVLAGDDQDDVGHIRLNIGVK